MEARISKSLVNALKPGEKDIKIRDTDLHGFELKITPTGKMVYRVDYRANGQRRCVTLGAHGVITPEQARVAAAKILQAVTAGNDPAEDKAEQKHGATVAEVAQRYLAEHAATKKKARSAFEDTRLIEKIIIPALGNRKLASITRANIAKLHHDQRKCHIRLTAFWL